MRDKTDLKRKLHSIDGAGYKAYKDIKGEYKFDRYVLAIDHVQGDPFASPSKVRIPDYPDGSSGNIRTLNRTIRTPCHLI